MNAKFRETEVCWNKMLDNFVIKGLLKSGDQKFHVLDENELEITFSKTGLHIKKIDSGVVGEV